MPRNIRVVSRSGQHKMAYSSIIKVLAKHAIKVNHHMLVVENSACQPGLVIRLHMMVWQAVSDGCTSLY